MSCTRSCIRSGFKSFSALLPSSSNGLYKSNIAPCIKRRCMATEAELPTRPTPSTPSSVPVVRLFHPPILPISELVTAPNVLVTLHEFPSLEPATFAPYPGTFLNAELRRDILQRAIVYEGAGHRLGRAKTLWRDEIHGSHRKVRPQKGTGRARLGTRQSPMLRGGGKAFGPKPRDFSIKLSKKMYDLAFRVALSYRYKRGQLFVVKSKLEVAHAKTRHIRHILRKHKWDRDSGQTLFVTLVERKNLQLGLRAINKHATVLKVDEVDVKDLLEKARVVIEQEALMWLLQQRGIHAIKATAVKSDIFDAASTIEPVVSSLETSTVM